MDGRDGTVCHSVQCAFSWVSYLTQGNAISLHNRSHIPIRGVDMSYQSNDARLSGNPSSPEVCSPSHRSHARLLCLVVAPSTLAASGYPVVRLDLLDLLPPEPHEPVSIPLQGFENQNA
jgi:hypothetical protein